MPREHKHSHLPMRDHCGSLRKTTVEARHEGKSSSRESEDWRYFSTTSRRLVVKEGSTRGRSLRLELVVAWTRQALPSRITSSMCRSIDETSAGGLDHRWLAGIPGRRE